MKKSKYLVLTALAAFALGGCTPEVTPEPSPEPAVVEVTSVTLDKSSEELTVGETLQLNATVNPSNATVKDLVWASSNADVASVSATGLVTAKHSGEAVITATAKGTTIKGSCTVTVSAAPVTGWTDAQKADFTAVLGVEVPFFEGMGIDSDWQYVSYVDDGYIGLASPELEDYTAAYGAFRNVMTAAADFEAMDQYGTKWAAETSKKYYLPENNAAFDALAVVALSVEEETSGYVVYVEMYLSMVEYQSDAFPTDFVAVVFGENTLPALTDAETYYFTAGVDEYFGETYAMIYAVPAEGATIDYATYVTALEAAGFKVSQYEGGEGYVPDTVDLVIESDEIYGYFYGEPDQYLTFELYFGDGGDVPPVPPVEGGIVIDRAVVCAASGLDVDGTYSYAQAAYTATVDEVEFEFSTGVGMATSKNNPGMHGLECMQWRKAPVKDTDKEVGHMANVTALATDTITIEFYVTFASEEFKYLPVVKASDTKEGTFENVLPDGVTAEDTVNGEATELKDGSKDIYKYELTYTLDGASFFQVETGAGALFVKAITIAPAEAQ